MIELFYLKQVQLDGVNFKKFSKSNSYLKPTDQQNINLMNFCAEKTFEHFKRDIICAYGFSDEFSFALCRKTTVFDRKFKYNFKKYFFFSEFFHFILRFFKVFYQACLRRSSLHYSTKTGTNFSAI